MAAHLALRDLRPLRACATLVAVLASLASPLALSGCGGATAYVSSGPGDPAAEPTSVTSPEAEPTDPGDASPEPEEPSPEPDRDAEEAPRAPGVGDSLAVLDDSRPRGELPRERIEAGIARGRPAMAACITRAAAEGRVEESRVVATFIIESTGAVESVAFLVSTLTDDALSECLLDALRSIRFDRPRGGIVMVSYPFQFRATGG